MEKKKFFDNSHIKNGNIDSIRTVEETFKNLEKAKEFIEECNNDEFVSGLPPINDIVIDVTQ